MTVNDHERVLGIRIFNARTDAKLSQRQLAKRTGVPAYRIADIECGMHHDHGDSVERLCDDLDIGYGDLHEAHN